MICKRLFNGTEIGTVELDFERIETKKSAKAGDEYMVLIKKDGHEEFEHVNNLEMVQASSLEESLIIFSMTEQAKKAGILKIDRAVSYMDVDFYFLVGETTTSLVDMSKEEILRRSLLTRYMKEVLLDSDCSVFDVSRGTLCFILTGNKMQGEHSFCGINSILDDLKGDWLD